METKILYFDGTMLVSSGKVTFKNQVSNIVGFEQTDKQRVIGEEYADEEIKPEVVFVFDTIESIDSVIKVLKHVKSNFVEQKKEE